MERTLNSTPRVFLSHASKDLESATELSINLEKMGFDPWLASEKISMGSNFAEEITKAIKSSSYFIVLLSKNSIASPHVKREVSIAVDKGIPLLPVIIGGSSDFISTLPEEWMYWLTVVQVVHFTDSTQTALEIAKNIKSGKFTGTGIATSRNRNSWIIRGAAAFGILLLVSSILIMNGKNSSNQSASVSTTSNSEVNTSTTTNSDGGASTKLESQNPPSSQSQGILKQIVQRLNKSGSPKWAIESKIDFPIGELGRIQSDDLHCEISVFDHIGTANYATQDRNYTTNATIGWLDKDSFSNNFIILKAIDGEEPCGVAASKAFGWPIKLYEGETYLIPGATPFERCIITTIRVDEVEKQEAISICRFQFERDGKAIPGEYMGQS